MDQFELKEKLEIASTQEERRELHKDFAEKKLEEHWKMLEKEPEKKNAFIQAVEEEHAKIIPLEKEQKLEQALKLAEQDFYKTIGVIKKSNDPWLEDEFHDKWVEKYY